MQKKFIKSFMLLVFSGLITKALGFIIKIVYVRIIGSDGIALYSMIIPTYTLFITFATFGIIPAISKLIAEKKYNSKSIIINSLFILLFINFIIITFTILFSDFIATFLLNNKNLKPLLISVSLVMPFISISTITKGYFYGKENIKPISISNILEQVLKLILVITIIPIFIKKSISYGVIVFILISIITELFSIFIMSIYIKKNKLKGKLEKEIRSSIYKITIPFVLARIISSIGYFFEPIIITNILLRQNFSITFITKEYAIYNTYVLGLFMLPSFFITALSQILIPSISKSSNDKIILKHKIKYSLIYALVIGITSSILIFIFKSFLLSVIYKTNNGINYINALFWIFPLFYLETPILSILQALNKSKELMKITITGVLIKSLSLIIFTIITSSLYGLILSEIINIIYVTLSYFKLLRKTIYL